MSLIAVDVDDTLYSFTDTAREELMKRAQDRRRRSRPKRDVYERAAYASWPDWRAPVDMLGSTRWVDVINSCHADDVILSRTPFEGAADVCLTLQEAGHKLIYLTSRQDHTFDATERWLVQNGFIYYDEGLDAKLACTGPDKLPYLNEVQPSVLIDDRPSTLVRFVFGPAACARFAFAKKTDYNHNLTDVPGIYVSPTWSGIRDGLRKKGFLDG